MRLPGMRGGEKASERKRNMVGGAGKGEVRGMLRGIYDYCRCRCDSANSIAPSRHTERTGGQHARGAAQRRKEIAAELSEVWRQGFGSKHSKNGAVPEMQGVRPQLPNRKKVLSNVTDL